MGKGPNNNIIKRDFGPLYFLKGENMSADEAVQFYKTNDRFKEYIDHYIRNNPNECVITACRKKIIREEIAEMYKKEEI